MSKKRIALLMAVVMVLGVAVGSTMAWLTDKTGDVTNTFTVGDINIKLQEHKLNEDGKTLGSTLTSTTAKDGNNYLFVPGDTLPKDPFVTVEKDSEDCYVFVKAEVTNNEMTVKVNDQDVVVPVINFAINSGWKFYDTTKDTEGTMPTEFKNGTYYFYREVSKDKTKDNTFNVLAADAVENAEYPNGCITVDHRVTKDMVEYINGVKQADGTFNDSHKPNLTFTAHAVQKANIAQNGQNEVAAAWDILFD